jgi:hypothetical protein
MHYTELLKFLILGGFCSWFQLPCVAQPIAEKASISRENLDNLVQGRLYSPNYFPIKGSPFLTKDWSLEQIRMLGKDYEAMPVWYDIYLDDLILLNQQGPKLYFIRLNKEHIAHFSVEGRHFINLSFSSFRDLPLRTGYYELAFQDKITLLVKRSLEVQEEDKTLLSFFSRNDRRFLIIKDYPHRVRNRKSLLDVVEKTDRKALTGFLKSEKIQLKRATEEEWLAVTRFLNTLQPDL